MRSYKCESPSKAPHGGAKPKVFALRIDMVREGLHIQTLIDHYATCMWDITPSQTVAKPFTHLRVRSRHR